MITFDKVGKLVMEQAPAAVQLLYCFVEAALAALAGYAPPATDPDDWDETLEGLWTWYGAFDVARKPPRLQVRLTARAKEDVADILQAVFRISGAKARAMVAKATAEYTRLGLETRDPAETIAEWMVKFLIAAEGSSRDGWPALEREEAEDLLARLLLALLSAVVLPSAGWSMEEAAASQQPDAQSEKHTG